MVHLLFLNSHLRVSLSVSSLFLSPSVLFVLSFCPHCCFLLCHLFPSFFHTFLVFDAVSSLLSLFLLLFLALLPFPAPLFDNHTHSGPTRAAVAVCFAELIFCPLMTAIPCCSLELLQTIQAENRVWGGKNLPSASHPAVMTMCVCISYLCVVFVVIQMSQYTYWDEHGDMAVCDDHYPGLIYWYCNSAQRDVCFPGSSVYSCNCVCLCSCRISLIQTYR